MFHHITELPQHIQHQSLPSTHLFFYLNIVVSWNEGANNPRLTTLKLIGILNRMNRGHSVFTLADLMLTVQPFLPPLFPYIIFSFVSFSLPVFFYQLSHSTPFSFQAKNPSKQYLASLLVVASRVSFPQNKRV